MLALHRTPARMSGTGMMRPVPVPSGHGMEHQEMPAKIVCLSNVYDQAYHDLRGEEIDRCLSWAKRRDLFRCLEMATGREVVVLSSPPKARARRSARWLTPVATRFSTHRQFFCGNWDAPKARVPLSWFFYARHILRHTRSGDLVMIDNYELLYVIAARFLNLFRRVAFVLEYEDGKHLIERSWPRVLGWLAESAGQPLIRAALLAHPSLGNRLAKSTSRLLVPGFLRAPAPPAQIPADGIIRFLYSGSLDRARGVDLLLETLPLLPQHGWHLDVSGLGPLSERISRFAEDARWNDKVTFHRSLPTEEYNQLLKACQVGLNCQRASDPISSVTFPSKVFTYLSAGLLVISSKASEMEQICQNACLYYEPETPQALAAVMKEAIQNFHETGRRLNRSEIFERYSLEGTAQRIREMFESTQLIAR